MRIKALQSEPQPTPTPRRTVSRFSEERYYGEGKGRLQLVEPLPFGVRQAGDGWSLSRLHLQGEHGLRGASTTLVSASTDACYIGSGYTAFEGLDLSMSVVLERRISQPAW
eukprot:9466430-Pyramimonas_sp.AAC.1